MDTSHESRRPAVGQVAVPYPPHPGDHGPLLRVRASEPVADSYRHNIIRLQVGDRFHEPGPGPGRRRVGAARGGVS